MRLSSSHKLITFSLVLLVGCGGKAVIDGTSGVPEGCGDGSCVIGENQLNCPHDCGAVQVSAGNFHACALLADGTVRCWGFNSAGQTGAAPGPDAPPRAVPGLGGVVAVSAGRVFTCALLTDSTVWCWGANMYHELGDGSLAARAVPEVVPGVTTVVAMEAGGRHSCAVLADSTVMCWGADEKGQLGDGAGPSSGWPVAVAGLAGVSAVAIGDTHTCALLSSGTAKCWGDNSTYPLLGNGTGADSNAPVAVSGLTGTLQIAASERRSCALRPDGTAACWGDNSDCALGGGNGGGQVPVAVHGLTGAKAITTGADSTCALLSDGTAVCWGANTYGQLGSASSGTSCGSDHAPWAVTGLTGVVSLSAGEQYACASRTDGSVVCWGRNDHQQLGNGTTVDSTIPVAVGPW